LLQDQEIDVKRAFVSVTCSFIGSQVMFSKRNREERNFLGKID